MERVKSVLFASLTFFVLFYSATGHSGKSLLLLSPLLMIGGVVTQCLEAFLDRPPVNQGKKEFLVFFWVLLSTGVTNWPLRLSFAISQPELQTLARQVEAGKAFTQPCRVGLLEIQQGVVHPSGHVVLWTDLKENGSAGFVIIPPADVTQKFNVWSVVTLNTTCQYIELE